MKNLFYLISLKTFFYLNCLAIIISCNHIEETLPWTKIEGKVIARYSSKPIANVNIIIQEEIFYSQKKDIYDTLAIITTNENGEFSYNFHAKTFEFPKDVRNVKYWLSVKKNSECINKEGFEVVKGKKNYYNIISNSFGYLTIHIKNQKPFDENDEICFCTNITTNGGTDCGYNQPYGCKYGINIDEDYINNQFSLYGNNYKIIKWWVTKNGITTAFVDSIFIKPCENNVFTVNY